MAKNRPWRAGARQRRLFSPLCGPIRTGADHPRARNLGPVKHRLVPLRPGSSSVDQHQGRSGGTGTRRPGNRARLPAQRHAGGRHGYCRCVGGRTQRPGCDSTSHADDSALRECHESRGTRYGERHSAQIDAPWSDVIGSHDFLKFVPLLGAIDLCRRAATASASPNRVRIGASCSVEAADLRIRPRHSRRTTWSGRRPVLAG